jgi:ABC-2 type transport system permease protein
LSRFPDLPGISTDASRTFYLIARREFLTRVRTRFFLIGTVVLMVLIGGYIVLQAAVINKTVTTVTVGFVGAAQVLAQPLKVAAAADRVKVEIHSVGAISDGEDQVRSGSLDALVTGDPTGPVVDVKDHLDPTVEATLTGLVQDAALNQALTESGVNPAPIESKVAAARIHLVTLDPNAALRTQRDVVGIFVAALLYIALQIYGQIVGSGVVEEKANRIIEILLSTVRPRQLLFGKVVGIGLMGFVQLALVGAVALVAVTKTQIINLPNVGVTAVAGGLLWFVLGFMFYALLYAAAGSLISRQEDLGAVTVPITMLILGSYLAFFWVVANPDNPVGIGLSMLPPFAPTLMPARMATGDAQVWQVVVAVVLMLLAIAGMNALAARIYSNSVLRIGSRVKLAEAWKGRA